MFTVLHIIDIALWIFIAPSVIYVFFFAMMSLLPTRKRKGPSADANHSFLVLFPAYHEDNIIMPTIQSFLQQTYPTAYFDVAVISDHISDEVNEQLRQLPITLHLPLFEKSSKAKALQYAIAHTSKEYDCVVILDADNIVRKDFLEQLNKEVCLGYQAIQCHRCAKNGDNDISILEGTSEEINNTIFRKAHNAIGMSSALIGSGMCFDFKWFQKNVNGLFTAVEDRELESMLMKQDIFIKYAADIPVLDEKVCTHDNFRRQRLRWMTGQIQSLLFMLPYLPTAIVRGNINYIDKTIQQALIPRSILLAITPTLSILTTLVCWQWGIRWWALFVGLVVAILIAIPSHLRTKAIFGKTYSFFRMVCSMLHNIIKMNIKNNDFIHTSHQK